MLTRFEFNHSQNRPGGCNQVRVTTNPLDHQADVGTVFIQPPAADTASSHENPPGLGQRESLCIRSLELR